MDGGQEMDQRAGEATTKGGQPHRLRIRQALLTTHVELKGACEIYKKKKVCVCGAASKGLRLWADAVGYRRSLGPG